jgi:predicted HicB family RNase H-like nuclease
MKKITDYANIYSYSVEYDQDDKIHISRCAELPTLSAHGKTQEEAFKEIKKVVIATLKWMSEENEEIPEPFGLHKFSGEFRVRMPPEKHRKIAIEANLQGVSMNQYIVSKL